jgi:hypothetical protein
LWYTKRSNISKPAQFSEKEEATGPAAAREYSWQDHADKASSPAMLLGQLHPFARLKWNNNTY